MTAPAVAADWPADLHLLRLPVAAGTLHLRLTGTGPALLLLHGTGTAGLSFRPLVHALAGPFTCIIPDLPGHGDSAFPADPRRLGIRDMAAAVASALALLRVPLAAIVGHSAGFVVGAQLALDGLQPAGGLVGLAPALWLPTEPRSSAFWPALAGLARSPLVAAVAARILGTPSGVQRLMTQSGSVLPPAQLAAYTTLAARPGQVRAALAMMAAWDLPPIRTAVARLDLPVHLIGGDRDPWFPPANLARQAACFARGTSETLRGAGHFLHEEQPGAIAAMLRARLSR